MIPDRLQSLLEHALDSQLKLHCLMLFTQRTLMRATAEQIGVRLSRDRWSVQEALDDLVACEILKPTPGKDGLTYEYTPSSNLAHLLGELTKAYEDPLQRVELYDQLSELAMYAPYRADFTQPIPF